ncbi:unnamed protein product [Psylliodes chrysocephalus]|uniref:PHD-type domain-containing protein n=1 Tax=Psylliodes chrysocephalus TaxID=3402493 RepID=A0A9P0D8M3_9CUCU|nr:unnamed protein product [Psylliodes chrysocephala]
MNRKSKRKRNNKNLGQQPGRKKAKELLKKKKKKKKMEPRKLVKRRVFSSSDSSIEVDLVDTDDDNNSSESNKISDNKLCVICDDEGKDRGLWFQCPKCKKWAHAACTDLDIKQAKAKKWLCDFCNRLRILQLKKKTSQLKKGLKCIIHSRFVKKNKFAHKTKDLVNGFEVIQLQSLSSSFYPTYPSK